MPRTGIMTPYGFTEKRFHKYNKPCFVQPKVEGDRLRVPFSIKDGVPLLLSSGGKVKVSVPHIEKILKEKGSFLKGMELDGELYVHGMPHEIIRSIVSPTVMLHPDHEQMEYHIFDLIHEQWPQRVRFYRLQALDLFPLILVPTWPVYTLDELTKRYEQCLEQGYEGVIIRDPEAPYERGKKTTKATCIMKLKPSEIGIYEVTAFVEEVSITGEPKGALGSLQLIDQRGEFFYVGSGFKRPEREHLWSIREDIPGRLAEIRYQALTKDRKVPKMQSFKRFVD